MALRGRKEESERNAKHLDNVKQCQFQCLKQRFNSTIALSSNRVPRLRVVIYQPKQQGLKDILRVLIVSRDSVEI